MPQRHKDAPPEERLYAPIEWESAGDYEDILYERGDGVARITINRPERRNAFRPPTLAELRDAFTRARDDLDVGSIILTGAGDAAFCSGGDQAIRGDDGYIGSDQVAGKGVGRLDVGDLHVQIRRTPKPVIAAVAGYAVGGGHILHLVCDLTQSSVRPALASAASTAASGRACSPARSAPSGRRRSGSCAASTTPPRRSRWGS
jgi:naphthoate synthase